MLECNFLHVNLCNSARAFDRTSLCELFAGRAHVVVPPGSLQQQPPVPCAGAVRDAHGLRRRDVRKPAVGAELTHRVSVRRPCKHTQLITITHTGNRLKSLLSCCTATANTLMTGFYIFTFINTKLKTQFEGLIITIRTQIWHPIVTPL